MDNENLHNLRNRARFYMGELNEHVVLKKYWHRLSLVLKGSTARGYSDRYSDIDFVLFTDAATKNDIVADYNAHGLSDRKDSIFLPLGDWEGHYNLDTYENLESQFAGRNMMAVWEYSNIMIMHDSGGRYEAAIKENTERLFAFRIYAYAKAKS